MEQQGSKGMVPVSKNAMDSDGMEWIDELDCA